MIPRRRGWQDRPGPAAGPAPEDVRLIIGPPGSPDRVISCGLLRDPDQDLDGQAAWIAVPREQVTLLPGGDWQVQVRVLPPGTQILLIEDAQQDDDPERDSAVRRHLGGLAGRQRLEHDHHGLIAENAALAMRTRRARTVLLAALCIMAAVIGLRLAGVL